MVSGTRFRKPSTCSNVLEHPAALCRVGYFWLIGNEVTGSVEDQRTQTTLPHGVVPSSKKYPIVVRTWSEVISDAGHRLKFVQASLKYESNRDQGLVSMRDK